MQMTTGEALVRQSQLQEGRRMSGTIKANRTRRPAKSTRQEPTGHDAFLKGLEASGGEIEVYFRDKEQTLVGRVKRSDPYTISVENSGTGLTHIVYKHAILEFIPLSKAPRTESENKNNNKDD